MDEATRARISAEQLVCLSSLQRGITPPGIRDLHTVTDAVEDAHAKYLSHFAYDVEFFFPAYWAHRRPSAKKLAQLVGRTPWDIDPFGNLDAIYDTLWRDASKLRRCAPWQDLLLIERAIAKSRVAPRVDREPASFVRRIRTARMPASRTSERAGVFLVWLTTDVITGFGYPGRDPRAARPLAKPTCAAIYRRPLTDAPEVVWLD